MNRVIDIKNNKWLSEWVEGVRSRGWRLRGADPQNKCYKINESRAGKVQCGEHSRV